MTRGEILRHAGLAWEGRTLECHQSLSSTNDRALELLVELGPRAHLAAIFAEAQTGGRGRLGRPWHTVAGLSVACTVIVSSGIPAEASGLIPLAACLAVANALDRIAGVEARLRWPNDVVAAGGKIAGVLAEGRWRGSEPEGFAVGMGVNLLQRPEDFPFEIRGLATSALAETGRPCSRPAFSGALLTAFEERIECLARGGESLLREASPRWSHEAGAPMEVLVEGDLVRGAFAGVGPAGELLLDTGAGVRTLVHGEVSMARSRTS